MVEQVSRMHMATGAHLSPMRIGREVDSRLTTHVVALFRSNNAALVMTADMMFSLNANYGLVYLRHSAS